MVNDRKKNNTNNSTINFLFLDNSDTLSNGSRCLTSVINKIKNAIIIKEPVNNNKSSRLAGRDFCIMTAPKVPSGGGPGIN